MSSKKRYVGPVLLTSAIAGTLAMGFGGTAWAEDLGVNKAAGAVSAGLSTPAMAAPIGSVPSSAELIDASVPEVPSLAEPSVSNPSDEVGGALAGGTDVEEGAFGQQEADGDQTSSEADGQISTEEGEGSDEAIVSEDDSSDAGSELTDAEGPALGGASDDEAPISAEQNNGGPSDAPDDVSQVIVQGDDVVLSGWQLENGSYVHYGVDGTKSTGWLVTDESIDGTSSGLQRYWLGEKGEGVKLSTDLFEAVLGGTKSWFFRTDKGYVARHKYVDEKTGNVYLADNEGRLEGPGWVVTNEYEADGSLQRYWIDANKHAAVVGYSEDGWAHYTTEDGYVLRGGRDFDDGRYWADNDGRLARNGWVVTGDFTGGALERYWAGSKGAFRFDGLFDTGLGYWAYAKDDTTILRTTLPFVGEDGRTYVYLADNDGRLAGPGWVISDAYGQGLQRYWVDADAHAAVVGYSEDGWAHYTTEDGYVLRGGRDFDDGRYWADNDGRLARNGWVVTGDFTGGALERYWAGSKGAFRFDGLFDTGLGYWAYAKDDTTILRTTLPFVGEDGRTYVYLADNDGRLAGPGWVISDAYGQGLQRYWVDADAHAAKTGYFEAEGSSYFGTDAGYVLRGTKRFELSSSGKFVQVADNDGKLIENFVSGAGWHVTGGMTDGALQRYYLVASGGHLYAEVDLFEVDQDGKTSLFYGHESTGYVSRNERISVNGKTYVSDNDGRLIVATVRVYLDSGHGASGGAGFDPGASGSGYQEYRLTEELVSMVADIVRSKYGIDVVTHGNTNYSDRQDEAEANECDFLVSIHFNSFNGSATGSESYIHSAHAAPGSAELQDIMHKHLVDGLGIYDRGQKQEQFAVVGGDVPAVLLEICFIDNSSDMAKYQARKQQLAESLAAGIWEYAQRIS